MTVTECGEPVDLGNRMFEWKPGKGRCPGADVCCEMGPP